MKFEWEREMIRPTVYKVLLKATLGVTACLLWERFINTDGLRTMWGTPSLLCGAVFLAGAWFGYLKMDGVSVGHLMKGWQKEKPKKKHVTKEMVDFVDEKVTSFDDLDDEEQTSCRFLSNLITGVLFLIPPVVTAFL